MAAKPQGPVAPKVDASGEFPSGETYTDFAGFRDYLAENREELFARGLIEKLLMYATGREMTPGDFYEIEDILEKVKADHGGLQTMVVEVMTSEIFRSR
ncbi:MAG: DUF1585 domain-containing protein [Verrucomicrobiae bacterium]|nr:DUF1585 domain-containing protein [Verrucomicrobiae bacterium]